jgi:ketosteroid isomerase-like protein
MTDGKMIEFREYCDTALIERVLEAPRAAAS